LIDVRDLGAIGDGVALDTDAVNAAIDKAAGGGTVRFPAGRYLCFSIRLKSGVTLHLEEGAVIVAADPAIHAGSYDPPEDNEHDLYQDFGHSHWRNSLIWGDGVEDVAITGPGLIDGVGMTREGPGSRWKKQSGEFPLSMRGLSAEAMAELVPEYSAMVGVGNKAIALKNARRIRLSGFRIARGGHFAILATGCDHMLIEDLSIDTNRDAIDIDCCRDIIIRRCRVNSPNDDAIVLKSSYALGETRLTERVEVSDCAVMGFDPGTMFDGTYGRTQERAPDQDRMTGRIKLGTESTGGYRDIVIRDCTFERSRGLALENVDGGILENVLCENLTLNEVTTAPLFIRLGARGRGPDPKPGIVRNIVIKNLVARDILPDYCAIVAGLPESPVENVTLSDIHLVYRGGGSAEEGMRRPGDLADAYPEPSMFGVTPAHGLWVRHVRGLVVENLTIETETPDARPAILLQSAPDARIAPEPPGVLRED
jgi:polygalacturonase